PRLRRKSSKLSAEPKRSSRNPLFSIRRAIPSDAEGIARAHVASFRDAYRGLLADDVLDGMDVVANANRKRNLIESGGGVFVAEEDEEVVAFAICGANRYPQVSCDGELQAIYVHPSGYRKGIGRALLVACVDHLCDGGFESMVVFLFRDNHQA